MPISATDMLQELALYGPATDRPTAQPKGFGFHSVRYVCATSDVFAPSEVDTFRNGPIVLSEAGHARMRQVLAQGRRRPLAIPPAARSDADPAR
jgi:hypothetical protein